MQEYKEPFRVGCATLSVEQVSRTAWDVSIVYDNDIKTPRRVTITNLEMVNTIISHVTADQEAMKHKENTRKQIQAMVTRGAGYAELKAALGPDSWVCVLTGQIKARAHDLPRALEGGDYHTFNHGKLATIEESTLAVGDTVLIQGKPYEVWANESTRGDVHMPSATWFVAVPK